MYIFWFDFYWDFLWPSSAGGLDWEASFFSFMFWNLCEVSWEEWWVMDNWWFLSGEIYFCDLKGDLRETLMDQINIHKSYKNKTTIKNRIYYEILILTYVSYYAIKKSHYGIFHLIISHPVRSKNRKYTYNKFLFRLILS